jgi:hypothetical protein
MGLGWSSRPAQLAVVADENVAPETESREPFVLARLASPKMGGPIRADADPRAVAHALSTLSFALAFSEQMLFRPATESLRRMAPSSQRCSRSVLRFAKKIFWRADFMRKSNRRDPLANSITSTRSPPQCRNSA